MTRSRTVLLLLLLAAFLATGTASAQECCRDTTTSDPQVNQNLRTARTAAFTSFALPRSASSSTTTSVASGPDAAAPAGEAEEDSEGKSGGRFSEFSSDVEYETFDSFGTKGDNLAIRAGYARETADARWLFGVNGVFNRQTVDLSFSDPVNFFVIQGFVNRFVSMTLDAETYAGISVTALQTDISDADPTLSVGIHVAQKRYVGNGTMAFGAMFQANKAGDLATMYSNVALMYGFPVGQTFSVNLDVMAVYNVYSALDGTKIDVSEKILLNPGVSVTYYPSRTFGLNLGVKTVLLVADYSAFEFVTGARFRF